MLPFSQSQKKTAKKKKKEHASLFSDFTVQKTLIDTFNTKTLKTTLWSTNKCNCKALNWQNSYVRVGNGSLKISLQKGDNAYAGDCESLPSERNELEELKPLGPKENEVHCYSFSIFLPKHFPIVSTRLVLAQWKQGNHGFNAMVDNPIIALRFYNGELFVTLQNSATLQTKHKKKKFLISHINNDDIRGKWLDFVFVFRLCRKSDGFVYVRMNENSVVNYKGITCYSEKQGYLLNSRFYFKWGLYRDVMNEPMEVVIDNFKHEYLV